ncbi:SNF1-related protein kinase regulatory subunit beta-2 [Physcomitrium patens]|uniref:Association with the SNF1 complex (ASC) domain-containing protein n=1 Tax=Physcomitrium patens TaxID=3218 RepID=A0A2K1JPZ1_PHYPA|nr:SNF1-related protein kinase regulatory subunit beta-2-like [Physcomitrium patens]PNR43615.1 hypothetical protein PHYPA_015996 [Physcomitrium patens]|eukprot:XP_024391599.1 SNF1-related protein kinase regulatory subunit beta-2-like [Physcomitrella patens]
MGNTNGREVGAGGGGQHSQSAVGGHGAVGGQRVGHPGYGVPPPGSHGHPQAQQMRDQGRLGHAPSTESMSQSPSESPGSAARSPLMFTPQVPMVPISKPNELSLGGYAQTQRASQQAYYETSLYGEPDKGVATMIVWSHGGGNVGVIGSWDNWQTRQPLQRSGRDFTLIKVLQPGVYQYKFWVDGVWRYAHDLPAVSDDTNNVNNVLDVQDYVPENLDSVAGFDPPRSPESSYNDPLPGPEDFAKEPPTVPPHLHLTLLNVPQQNEASASLPRPQHVILNHLYVEKEKTNRSVIVLGTTNRFRSKYVTTVLYKPLMM